MQEISSGMKRSGAVEISQRLGEISAGKVLDVGTQDGSFIKMLMKTLKDFGSFIGIDISEEDLEKARGKFKDNPVEFARMNAEDLVFDDGSFDTVCISHSIHHLENPKQVLTEMERVLKPGGYLILQEMFCDGNQNKAKQTDILSHHWSAKVDSLEGIPHFETLSRKQIVNLVKSLNITIFEKFESKRYVKCLFCEDQVKCEDPMNGADFAIEEVDRILGRMSGHPTYPELKEEADILRKRIKLTGSEPASLLFFICRK